MGLQIIVIVASYGSCSHVDVVYFLCQICPTAMSQVSDSLRLFPGVVSSSYPSLDLSPLISTCLYAYYTWCGPPVLYTCTYNTHAPIHYTDGLYCKCICIVCSTWLQSPYTTDFTWVLWSEIHHPSIDPGCGTCCHEDQVSCCCTMLYIIGSEFWEGWQVAAHLQAPARPRVFPKYIKMSDGININTMS